LDGYEIQEQALPLEHFSRVASSAFGLLRIKTALKKPWACLSRTPSARDENRDLQRQRYYYNGRLPVLLRWLESSTPDVVCLQELKAPQEKFPKAALEKLGYRAIWHGQKSWNGVAILARGVDPVETRRGLPGDADDAHSRYIEATVRGLIVGCLYLPNGNPAPGPKFDYKLRWFERLIAHASELLSLNAPVALIGDYNVMPTDLDVYKPERWVDDALL